MRYASTKSLYLRKDYVGFIVKKPINTSMGMNIALSQTV